MNIFDWKSGKSWPNFLGSHELIDEDINDELFWKFFNSYTHIQAYHASRPIDPELILEEGLRIADYRELEKDFQKNMRDYCNIEVSLEQINEAIQRTSQRDNRKLFFTVDDSCFFEQTSAAYHLYGSEYIHALANKIFNKECGRGKNHLPKIGTPTVFIALLDIDLIPEETLRELVININNYTYHNEKGNFTQFAIELVQSVPGQSIVSYYNPELRINYNF